MKKIKKNKQTKRSEHTRTPREPVNNLQQSTGGVRMRATKRKTNNSTAIIPSPIKPTNNDTDSIQSTDIIPLSDNPNSIWFQDKFPAKTKPFSFPPKKLKETLIDYAHNIKPIDQCLTEAKIEPNTFFHLLRVYDEISELYLAAQRLKARKYGEAALKLWDILPNNPVFYQADRCGNPCLTAAAVRYLEVKATQYHRFAQIHEIGSFIPVSKQENVNRNLSLGVTFQAKLPDEFDLALARPEDLIDAIKGK